MKTTLIQIDPHDDLISIKDKMTWAKSQRMLLFFPKGYPLDQSSLTMKLIRRYAEANGTQVGIITKNHIMREIASEQDIPCFISAPQAEKKTWPQPKQLIPTKQSQGLEKIIEKKKVVNGSPKSKRILNLQKIITYSILLIISLAGLMVILPSATITIYPETSKQDISYQVIADPGSNGVNINGTIPAAKVSISVSGDLAADSTGKIIIPKTRATGEIEIKNLTDKALVLPRGTIVSTNGSPAIEFYLTADVTLPSSSDGIKNVAIEAVNAGEIGNVGSNQITKVAGLEQSISIANSKATNGGTQQSFSTPSESDYANLEISLRTGLLSKCKNGFITEGTENGTLLEKSVAIDKVITRTQTPKVGEPSERAVLSLEVSCSALVVNQNDEKQLAKLLLDQEIPNLLTPVNDQIAVEAASPISVNSQGQFTWNATASRDLMQNWYKDNVLKLITGKKRMDAEEILKEAFRQTKIAQIEITPRWWKWMPFIPDRITVEIGSLQ